MSSNASIPLQEQVLVVYVPTLIYIVIAFSILAMLSSFAKAHCFYLWSIYTPSSY